jgi:hypothetical protein
MVLLQTIGGVSGGMGYPSSAPGGQVGRWAGGQVGRWAGGQVGQSACWRSSVLPRLRSVAHLAGCIEERGMCYTVGAVDRVRTRSLCAASWEASPRLLPRP